MWVTLLVLALLGAWTFFAIRAVKKNKHRCCGDCANCRAACREKRETDPT